MPNDIPLVMNRGHLSFCLTGIILALAIAACASAASSPARDANAGIDSLNARLVNAYRQRDPRAYAALFTDSAVFEWPAFATVRGPAALGAMARDNWTAERDVDLRLDVGNRRLGPDHATEFGAFQQSWTDTAGARMTEYGRYVAVLLRQKDGAWRMDRFFGFEDSTRSGVRH
jgi:ketosteroid isomerase-like protein